MMLVHLLSKAEALRVVEAHEKMERAAQTMLNVLLEYDRRMTDYWGSLDLVDSKMEDARHIWPMVKAAIKKATGEE